MLPVDNLAIIRVLKRRSAELPADFRLDGEDELIPDSFVTENIIRCNAGLSTVQVLSEHDTSGCQLDLGGGIHDTRAFSTEL